MILSDKDILDEIEAGDLKIEPFDKGSLSPSTLDVHLGPEILVFKTSHSAIEKVIDLSDSNVATALSELCERKTIPDEGYKLEPQQFILAYTKEKITLPSKIAARLEGRSTNARFGISIHNTAPTIHPTYSGRLALEICNRGKLPCVLREDFPIGQLIFERVESEPLRSLQTVWQGQ